MGYKPNRKIGQPKKLQSSKKLWEFFCIYFEWAKSNPIQKEDFIKSGEMAGTKIKVDLERPLTWAGFEAMLRDKNIIAKMEDYKANKEGRYSEYTEVISRIDGIMWEDKYAGASVGIYNANIISRDLGLIDKVQNSITIEQPLFPE